MLTWKYVVQRAERDVLDHDEHVGNCQPFEDGVDGCFGHVLARQHDDIEDVRYRAEDANLFGGW